MNSILFGTAECLGLPIQYFLLTEPMDHEADRYGISVQYGQDTISIPDLSISREDTERLLTKLMNGCVTPVSVRDIVDDWLSM